MNSNQTNFIHINNNYWGLAEFDYSQTVYPLSKYDLLRIKNYGNKEIVFCSNTPELKNWLDCSRVIGNTINNCCITPYDGTDSSTKIRLSIDKKLSFYESLEPTLSIDDSYYLLNNWYGDTNILNNTLIHYNKLRIYIKRGYNFISSHGFYLKLNFKSKKYQKTITIVSIAYNKSDNLKYLGSDGNKVLKIGGEIYDRYLEVLVPICSDMINVSRLMDICLFNYYSEQLKDNEDKDTLIKKLIGHFSLMKDYSLELEKIKDIGEYIKYEDFTIEMTIDDIEENLTDEYGRNVITVSRNDLDSANNMVGIPIKDTYQGIFAKIKEENNGDYFVYYGAYENSDTGSAGYIEDWRSKNDNDGKSNYVIYHTITLWVQIESEGEFKEKILDQFTVEQVSNFDEPFYYRPVIFDNRAKSFTIEYNIRIIDANGYMSSQILRTSTLTCNDAQKYGIKRTGIVLSNSQPIKIINKIYDRNI